MLYLPLTPTTEYSANGVTMQKNSFAILEPGCEFCISTKTDHDWCALSLPNELRLSRPQDSPSTSGPTVRVAKTDGRTAHRFRQIVQETIALATKTTHFEASVASLAASAELQSLAAGVLRQTDPHESRSGRPRVRRDLIIDRTREYLRQREGHMVLVGELADAAGVSERTLRNAFNDYFGISPVRYLQFRQLNQVNRVLRLTAPEKSSVSSILVRHGVWEFSRFAARYRRLFGELPSETLRRPISPRGTSA